VESEEEHKLYISKDGQRFSEAKFPGTAHMRQEGFTILDSTPFSLTVDIATSSSKSSLAPSFGTLFFSNEEGTAFSLSLNHTNRARNAFVDFETIQAYNYDGILLSNIVSNVEEIIEKELWSEDDKKLVSKMSFNHGNTWQNLEAPKTNAQGQAYECAVESCSLHLHSVTHPHNLGRVFSTTSAPGLVLGVGSVGPYLKPYEQCDTFLSTDAGKTWKTIAQGPYKYESADAGSLLVL
jgi:hypothetical protein